MKFSVYFHFQIDTDSLAYGDNPICQLEQITYYPGELWSRHPDLTLLAIL